MKLHKVYTSRGDTRTKVGIPDLILVMYFIFGNTIEGRLRKFHSSVEEFDTRVTKEDFA